MAGKQYPAGSFVIKTAQAARAHVLDMFEPQDHPNDFAYPGGPPRRPYDNAGWTLAYQMGVKFDRVLDGFDVPTRSSIRGTELAKPWPGTVAGAPGAAGYLMSHEENDAFTVINRVFKADGEVYWTQVADAGERQDVSGGHVLRPGGDRCRCCRSRRRTSASASSASTARPRDAQQAVGQAHRARATGTAARCRPAGRASSSSNFEIPFRSCTRRISTPATSSRKYDVHHLPVGRADSAARGGRRRRWRWRWWRRRWRPRRPIPAEFQTMQGNLTTEDDAAGSSSSS